MGISITAVIRECSRRGRDDAISRQKNHTSSLFKCIRIEIECGTNCAATG